MTVKGAKRQSVGYEVKEIGDQKNGMIPFSERCQKGYQGMLIPDNELDRRGV